MWVWKMKSRSNLIEVFVAHFSLHLSRLLLVVLLLISFFSVVPSFVSFLFLLSIACHVYRRSKDVFKQCDSIFVRTLLLWRGCIRIRLYCNLVSSVFFFFHYFIILGDAFFRETFHFGKLVIGIFFIVIICYCAWSSYYRFPCSFLGLNCVHRNKYNSP